MDEIYSIMDKITTLALHHKAAGDNIDDMADTDWLEEEALMLIADYAEKIGISVEGFPQQKKELAKTDDFYDEDYFCLERYQLYVDLISMENTNISDLNWHYVNSFWPGEFNDKVELLESIKARIDSGVFYDVKF